MRYATRTGFDGQVISVGRVILTRREGADAGEIEPAQVVKVDDDDTFVAQGPSGPTFWSPKDYQHGMTSDIVCHTLKAGHWCFPPVAKPEPREHKAILPSSDLA